MLTLFGYFLVLLAAKDLAEAMIYGYVDDPDLLVCTEPSFCSNSVFCVDDWTTKAPNCGQETTTTVLDACPHRRITL